MTLDAPPPRVLIDCDPGLDDSIALLMLSQLHREGAIVLDAITTVAGNNSAARCASNARYSLRAAGLSRVAVVGGAPAPLGHPTPFVDGKAFHGRDGLADLNPQPGKSEERGDVASEIVSWARSHANTGKKWLLCTGPLTNVALALQLEPDFVNAVDRVVIMGGALGRPLGNIQPWAEFNFFADPRAAAIVCASRLPVELIPLDVTERLVVRPSQIEGLTGTLPGRLLAASINYTRQAIGVEGCFVHDPMAAATLVAPTLVQMETLALAVDDSGPRPGRVRRRRGGSDMKGATMVNAPATWSLILGLLERSLPHLDWSDQSSVTV